MRNDEEMVIEVKYLYIYEKGIKPLRVSIMFTAMFTAATEIENIFQLHISRI